MFKIFFLIVNITTGSTNVAVSNESYSDLATCKEFIDRRVEDGNRVLNPAGGFVKAALCMTEDEFNRKRTEQPS